MADRLRGLQKSSTEPAFTRRSIRIANTNTNTSISSTGREPSEQTLVDKDNAGPSSGRSTASGAAGGMATRNGERVEWKGEAPGKTVKEQQREMQKRCREFVPRAKLTRFPTSTHIHITLHPPSLRIPDPKLLHSKSHPESQSADNTNTPPNFVRITKCLAQSHDGSYLYVAVESAAVGIEGEEEMDEGGDGKGQDVGEDVGFGTGAGSSIGPGTLAGSGAGPIDPPEETPQARRAAADIARMIARKSKSKSKSDLKAEKEKEKDKGKKVKKVKSGRDLKGGKEKGTGKGKGKEKEKADPAAELAEADGVFPAAEVVEAEPSTDSKPKPKSAARPKADKKGYGPRGGWDDVKLVDVRGKRPLVVKVMLCTERVSTEDYIDREYNNIQEVTKKLHDEAVNTGNGEYKHAVVPARFKAHRASARVPGGLWVTGFKVIGYDLHLPMTDAYHLFNTEPNFAREAALATARTVALLHDVDLVHQDLKRENTVAELEFDAETHTFTMTGRILLVDLADTKPENTPITRKTLTGTLKNMPINVGAAYMVEWLVDAKDVLTWNEVFKPKTPEEEICKDRVANAISELSPAKSKEAKKSNDLWALGIIISEYLCPEAMSDTIRIPQTLSMIKAEVRNGSATEERYRQLKRDLTLDYSLQYDYEFNNVHLAPADRQFEPLVQKCCQRPIGTDALLGRTCPSEVGWIRNRTFREVVSEIRGDGLPKQALSYQQMTNAQPASSPSLVSIVAYDEQMCSRVDVAGSLSWLFRSPGQKSYDLIVPCIVINGILVVHNPVENKFPGYTWSGVTYYLCDLTNQCNNSGMKGLIRLDLHLFPEELSERKRRGGHCAESLSSQNIYFYILANELDGGWETASEVERQQAET